MWGDTGPALDSWVLQLQRLQSRLTPASPVEDSIIFGGPWGSGDIRFNMVMMFDMDIRI